MDGWKLATAILGALLLLALAVLWSLRRHRSPRLALRSDQPVDALIDSLAGLTFGTVVDGNAVELLKNGAFFDAMLASVAGARSSVHMETFLWKDGVLGRRVAAALEERARAGCEVRLVLDAIGCKKIGAGVLEGLEKAGCRVVRFHPRRLRQIGWVNDRTHRKIVVVDGCEAFVGGHCIVDDWLGEGEDGCFIDLSVRLRGPAVHAVQSAFGENWVGATGEVFAGHGTFPPLAPAGGVKVHVAYTKPQGSAPAVKILHHTAICMARRRIWIQNPYFIPEPEAIDAFGEAVRRGVDVRVLMPSAGGSDMPMVQHAGHRNFERLMRCGVRLFEYPDTLLHQKVMTVDGSWSAIGSCNFDDRSFETNDEITLGVLDRDFTAALDAEFERYAARSREIEVEAWRRRGLWHRLKDHAFYSINEFL